MPDKITRLRELRREAEANGVVLRKVPTGSRWYDDFGPYMMLDPSKRHSVVVSGLQDLDAVEEWLRGRRRVRKASRPRDQAEPHGG